MIDFQATSSTSSHLSFRVIFTPLLLLQGACFSFATFRLVEKVIISANRDADSGRYLILSSQIHEFFGFLHHGSRYIHCFSVIISINVVTILNIPFNLRHLFPICFSLNTVTLDSFKPWILFIMNRLLGWWSIDGGSREEQARLYNAASSRWGLYR